MVGLECVADGKYKHFKYTQIQIHIVIFKMVSNKNMHTAHIHEWEKENIESRRDFFS